MQYRILNQVKQRKSHNRNSFITAGYRTEVTIRRTMESWVCLVIATGIFKYGIDMAIWHGILPIAQILIER